MKYEDRGDHHLEGLNKLTKEDDHRGLRGQDRHEILKKDHRVRKESEPEGEEEEVEEDERTREGGTEGRRERRWKRDLNLGLRDRLWGREVDQAENVRDKKDTRNCLQCTQILDIPLNCNRRTSISWKRTMLR